MTVDIDFQIFNTYDPRTIVVADTSTWGPLEGKPAIIEVVMPGESEPVVLPFFKHNVNVLNSSNLGVKCSTCNDSDLIDLEDGVYVITVKGSPDTFNKERSYLKADRTRLKLDNFISSISTCDLFTNEVIQKIQKIQVYLMAADSNTRVGDYCTAQDLLFKAQKLIGKLNSCTACA